MPVGFIVNWLLFLYPFIRKRVLFVDSYDNDWLFLDDDLFPIDEAEEDGDRTCPGNSITPIR